MRQTEILINMQRDIGRIREDVGYVRGKIVGVCQQQVAMDGRITRLEQQSDLPHPVQPGRFRLSALWQTLIYAGIGLMAVLGAIGALVAYLGV